MATEQPSMPVNGHYAPHQAQGYGVAEQNYAAHNANNSTSAAAGYGASGPSSGNNNSSNGASDIPKEEVGWYFVEQYYTTLSRSPEKLFVSGRGSSGCPRSDHQSANFHIAILQQTLPIRVRRRGGESGGLCRSEGRLVRRPSTSPSSLTVWMNARPSTTASRSSTSKTARSVSPT